MNKVVQPFKYNGKIVANYSKSYLQRALVLSSISEGASILSGFDYSKDVQAAMALIQNLGAKVRIEKNTLIITGNPSSARVEKVSLHVGESGLLLRMIAPIASVLSLESNITGQGSLLKRDMLSLKNNLGKNGLTIVLEKNSLPMSIQGSLLKDQWQIDASEGSQLLSGLLMSLPLLGKSHKIEVSNLVSIPYIDLTLELMKKFGVNIDQDHYKSFSYQNESNYIAAKIEVEGDWSGAANHLVGAAISGALDLDGLQVNSKQADKAILTALNDFGAIVEWHGTTLHIKRNHLFPFSFDASDSPDLFPPLSVLASAAIGTSEIKGLHRLTNKESNRQNSCVALLEALGVQYRIQDDSLLIDGKGSVKGGTIATFNDHRIAMAGAIAAGISKQAITIENRTCVEKSYPEFFKDLEKATVSF